MQDMIHKNFVNFCWIHLQQNALFFRGKKKKKASGYFKQINNWQMWFFSHLTSQFVNILRWQELVWDQSDRNSLLMVAIKLPRKCSPRPSVPLERSAGKSFRRASGHTAKILPSDEGKIKNMRNNYCLFFPFYHTMTISLNRFAQLSSTSSNIMYVVLLHESKFWILENRRLTS